MGRPVLCLHAALLTVAVAVTGAGCVVWPAGTGPDAEPMSLAQARDLRDRGQAVLVDVRSPQEFAAGHLAGAVNIPLSEVADRVAEIRSLGRLPILYCG
jgi:hypothetical protein